MAAFAAMTGEGSCQLSVVSCQKARKAWMAAFAAMTGEGSCQLSESKKAWMAAFAAMTGN